jgi:hypothetical protein
MALNFDGTDDYIAFTDNLGDGLTAFSYGCWFRQDVLEPADIIGRSQYSGSPQFRMFGWNLTVNATDLIANIEYDAQAGTDFLAATTNLVADVWNHGMITWSTTRRDIYLNGVSEDNDTTSRTNISTPTIDYDFVIGARDNDAPVINHFDGAISHVCLWNATLTAEEVAMLAAGAHPLKIRRDNIIFYVPLYDTNYTNDLSGVGSTGSVNSAPTTTDGPPIAPSSTDLPGGFFAAAAGAYVLNCDAGSYTVTGQDPALTVARKLLLDAGSYAVTGQDPALTKGTVLALDAGAYTVTGQAATLVAGRALALDAGAYIVTGQATTFTRGRTITLDAGSYTVTGQATTFTRGRTITFDAGSYTVTGQTTTLAAARVLALDAGSYAVSGQAITFISGYALSCDAGSYAVTGQTTALVIARQLALDAGSYVVTGLDATLTYTPVGGYEITLDTGS